MSEAPDVLAQVPENYLQAKPVELRTVNIKTVEPEIFVQPTEEDMQAAIRQHKKLEAINDVFAIS